MGALLRFATDSLGVILRALGRGPHGHSAPARDVAALIGAGDRHARRLTATLLDKGVLTAAAAGAPLRLVFPAALAGRWMPGLFPEQP